eukprot:TRINITY_DN13235_c0_g3_i1.p1 TRINITY_DN13235_c0_g3~~TRINITY_DN13235_c0_g3_i1.p1  ORF type:complete len:195 (+),score=65.95 TRINITY_DN13235_c0_g3_i1:196-780(+)
MDPLKVVLLGNSGVGKTSVVQRFAFGKFKDAITPTLGAMFLTKCIDLPQKNMSIKFNLWDTAGQERYHSLAATYYKDAAIALIVYDITNLSTFEGAKNWVDEVSKNAPLSTLVFLVGNKSDLIEHEQVDPKLAQTYAQEQKIKFKLVSAKTGAGVKDIFTEAAKEFLDRSEEVRKKTEGTKLNAANTGMKRKCC